MDPGADSGGSGSFAMPLQIAVREVPRPPARGARTADVSPFVPLTFRSRYSRPLLGRIAAEGGETLCEVAIKLSRDKFLLADSKFPALSISNPVIDAAWRREREALVQSRGPNVVRLFDLGKLGGRIGPTAYCLERELFLPVVSPSSAAPLELCRDDELLQDCGLEAYGDSAVRYLHQPEDGVQRFWTWETSSGLREKEGVTVGRQTELYAAAADRLLDASAAEELAGHPCLSCEHRVSCYSQRLPSDEERADATSDRLLVESRLVPLSYYGSDFLVSEMLDLHYDELSDYLGGGGAAEILRPVPMETPVRERLQGRLGRADRSIQFSFGQDPSSALPLEVLHLKLTAFLQLCRGVQGFHQKTGLPHLGISPDNVMAELKLDLDAVPARWRFQVKLVDLGTRLELDLDPEGASGPPPLPLPEPHATRSFLSPFLDPGEFSFEAPLQLAGKAVVSERGGYVQAVEAVTRYAEFRSCAPGDVLRLTPYVSLPGLGAGPFFGIVERVDGDLPRFRIRLENKEEKFPPGFEAGATIYRHFRAPCDLYGLGLLLLRTLLVNDRNDMVSLEESALRLLAKVHAMLAAEDQPSQEDACRLLGECLDRASMGSQMLLFRTEDRERYADSIPDAIWRDLLVIGFRMMSTEPSLALFPGHGLGSGVKPEAVVGRVIGTLEAISDRVRIELFAAPARDREIGIVCRDMLAEVNDVLFGAEGDQ